MKNIYFFHAIMNPPQQSEQPKQHPKQPRPFEFIFHDALANIDIDASDNSKQSHAFPDSYPKRESDDIERHKRQLIGHYWHPSKSTSRLFYDLVVHGGLECFRELFSNIPRDKNGDIPAFPSTRSIIFGNSDDDKKNGLNGLVGVNGQQQYLRQRLDRKADIYKDLVLVNAQNVERITISIGGQDIYTFSNRNYHHTVPLSMNGHSIELWPLLHWYHEISIRLDLVTNEKRHYVQSSNQRKPEAQPIPQLNMKLFYIKSRERMRLLQLDRFDLYTLAHLPNNESDYSNANNSNNANNTSNEKPLKTPWIYSGGLTGAVAHIPGSRRKECFIDSKQIPSETWFVVEIAEQMVSVDNLKFLEDLKTMWLLRRDIDGFHASVYRNMYEENGVKKRNLSVAELVTFWPYREGTYEMPTTQTVRIKPGHLQFVVHRDKVDDVKTTIRKYKKIVILPADKSSLGPDDKSENAHPVNDEIELMWYARWEYQYWPAHSEHMQNEIQKAKKSMFAEKYFYDYARVPDNVDD